jgi:hypothetical protein
MPMLENTAYLTVDSVDLAACNVGIPGGKVAVGI